MGQFRRCDALFDLVIKMDRVLRTPNTSASLNQCLECLESMSVLHLGASSKQDGPQRGWTEGETDSQMKGGWREETVLLATDLRNYPCAAVA